MVKMTQPKVKTPWIECERCSIYLLTKDSSLHLQDCPPNLQDITYNFLKNSCLYGSLDVKVSLDIKNFNTCEVDNLVFLSQASIQLGDFVIGEWAIIEDLTKLTAPIAKIVWPTTEKSLTSVLLTPNCMDLSFKIANKRVKVSKISTNLCPAQSVTIVGLNHLKILDISPELYNRISKSFEDRILTKTNKINVMFYGKLLKFVIKSIEAGRAKNNLEQAFSSLTVQDEYEFFVLNSTTKWHIYRDDKTFEKDRAYNHITLTPAGVNEELQDIRSMIKLCLTSLDTLPQLQIRSVLLYGNSGTGKTMIANYLAKESKANVTYISPPDLYSKHTGSSVEETLRELFSEAINHSPSIIILDEIDILCPSRNSKLTDSEKRIVSTIILLLDDLNKEKDNRVFLIAITNKLDNIDTSLRRCGRLDREIEIPTPNWKSRQAILFKFIQNNLSENELQEIAMVTHGFVGADLVSLYSEAVMCAWKRGDQTVNACDLKFALKRVKPSAMREVQIEISNIKWSDIGGQENLKLILKQAVEWPLKYPDSFIRLGILPPKGVLMFGPPGCSKTMIAKALATESGLNFLSIKGPELFSKWVGESERAVRELFKKARQVAPSIIFFDEIDALGGERSSGASTSVQERVLAQLLTELDGITPLQDVTILAATNRPDRIDKALLRPGRLDRMVYVPLPDNCTRREIFRIKLSKMPVVGIDIDELVENTFQYSGAEINAVCHEAAMLAMEESLDVKHVERRHFIGALRIVTPRTPLSLIKLYEDCLQIKID